MLGDSGNKESPFELLILIICELSTGGNQDQGKYPIGTETTKIGLWDLQVESGVSQDHFWVSK